jgi:hypothetical protein
VNGGGDAYGYVADFEVNAKNRFGGYVGRTPYIAAFQDGRLINITSPGNGLITREKRP